MAAFGPGAGFAGAGLVAAVDLVVVVELGFVAGVARVAIRKNDLSRS
jgi:hypothetical protein